MKGTTVSRGDRTHAKRPYKRASQQTCGAGQPGRGCGLLSHTVTTCWKFTDEGWDVKGLRLQSQIEKHLSFNGCERAVLDNIEEFLEELPDPIWGNLELEAELRGVADNLKEKMWEAGRPHPHLTPSSQG